MSTGSGRPDGLTHLDESGAVHVVDVSEKATTRRRAVAESWVEMSEQALERLTSGEVAKGDALATARIAAIMAVKRTSELIPLCHPLPIEAVACRLDAEPPKRLRIEVEVGTSGKTGVEMEALTGATVAGLAIYDMLKAIDPAMRLGPTKLLRKEGGKSDLRFESGS